MSRWIESLKRSGIDDVNDPRHLALIPKHVHYEITTDQKRFWSQIGREIAPDSFSRLQYKELINDIEALPVEQQEAIFKRYKSFVATQKANYADFYVDLDSSSSQIDSVAKNSLSESPMIIKNDSTRLNTFKKTQSLHIERTLAYADELANGDEFKIARLQPGRRAWLRNANRGAMFLGIGSLLSQAKAVASPNAHQRMALDDFVGQYRGYLVAKSHGRQNSEQLMNVGDSFDKYLASIGSNEVMRGAMIKQFYSSAMTGDLTK